MLFCLATIAYVWLSDLFRSTSRRLYITDFSRRSPGFLHDTQRAPPIYSWLVCRVFLPPPPPPIDLHLPSYVNTLNSLLCLSLLPLQYRYDNTLLADADIFKLRGESFLPPFFWAVRQKMEMEAYNCFFCIDFPPGLFFQNYHNSHTSTL